MKERIIQLDLLRLIAIVSVVIMHSTGAVQKFYADGIDSVFIITNIPNSITRFAVPLFVMISGRLMINRGHDYKFLIYKSLHYLGIFFFWSTLYSLVLNELPYFKTYSIKSMLVNTVIDSLSGWFHFWFLFLICGIYLILPVVELIINNISKSVLRYYCILNILFCFFGKTLMEISLFNSVLGEHLNSFLVGFLNIYTFYFMLGYWLKDYSIKNKKIFIVILMGGLAFNAIIGIISSQFSGARMVGFIDAQSPVTLLVCTCLFILVNNSRPCKGRLEKGIIILSELSFGVYLIHMLIIECIKKLYPSISSALWAGILTVIFTILAGYCISWILWQNKLVRKVIK